jgi:hypothetical protein
LAAKLRAKHEGTIDEAFYVGLADALEADRAVLDRLIASLGIPRNRFKEAAGWLAEKVSRLKLNERLSGSARLTNLLELETLALGVEGKLALWENLETVAPPHSPLAAADFDRLTARAREQLDGLGRQRLVAARAALQP